MAETRDWELVTGGRSRRALVCLFGAALAIGVGAQLAVAGSPGDFAEPATSPAAAGGGASSIAISDFNGDATPDLAVANQHDANATILLGDGTGDFTPAGSSPEPAGPSPLATAAGDFDGDGKMDLAVTNATSSGNVTVLLGQGNGNLSPAGTSPEAVGNLPASMVASDFDSDGNLDLAVANVGSGNATILLGDGTGNFTAAPTSPETTGSGPFAITAGNFNGDGKPDLAVANADDDNVTILLGDGTGNFTEPGTSPEPAGDFPGGIVTSDFNRDGNRDLGVGNLNSSTVTVLLGDGSGDFVPSGSSPETVDPSLENLTASDLNGDGKPDLAVAEDFPAKATVLLGDGSGDFAAPATSPEIFTGDPVYVASGDLNGDGKPDLALPNFNPANVTILLNQTSHTDLGLAMDGSADPASVGATLTYTVTVTNHGPDDSTGGVVDDDLPSGVAFLDASTGCSFMSGSGHVLCVVGALPAGSSKQVQIRVRPTAPSPPTLSNTASIDANEQDLNAANDATSELTSVRSSGVSCLGHVATILGTGNGETIRGNSASETIASLGGDDTVFAIGGNDFVCGGAGDDALNVGSGLNGAAGGSGDDTLTGGMQADTLRGGSGADAAQGGAGNDILNGNDGDDNLMGGPGRDACNGGSGTDTATGCETTTGVP